MRLYVHLREGFWHVGGFFWMHFSIFRNDEEDHLLLSLISLLIFYFTYRIWSFFFKGFKDKRLIGKKGERNQNWQITQFAPPKKCQQKHAFPRRNANILSKGDWLLLFKVPWMIPSPPPKSSTLTTKQ